MDEPIQVLAGTGGVALGEARTNHEGRKAIFWECRGTLNVTPFIARVVIISTESQS